MRLIFTAIAVLVLWTACTSTPGTGTESQQAKITIPQTLGPGLVVMYIANEGVLISSGEKQVLIDGLHREYKRAYAFPPPELRDALEFARAPFNQVDLVLVSHLHLDHFHPQSVGLHLKNNPGAILVSSDQIVDGVKKDFESFGEIESRVKRVTPEWKTKTALTEKGVELTVLGLRHANANFSWIQNLGHLITIDGKKFLHVGDADGTVENFAAFRLADENIDVAFIPYWYLLSDSGRALVRDHIRPKHVIAVHISPDEGATVTEQIRKAYPEAVAFTRIGESRSF